MRWISCLQLIGLIMLCISDVRGAATPSVPWDLSGVIGTGQSLSVGARASKITSNEPSANNLKLWTDDLPWPINAGDPQLKLVPFTEPVGRYAPGYPSSWPENIDGETWHWAMATELTDLVHAATGRDFVSVQGEFGEDGKGMVLIKKDAVPVGINGRSYAAAMIWTHAVARLAKASGKTFGVGAVIVTHGETDAGNQHYEDQLHTLWQNYDTDIRAITGQTQTVQMIVSQQDSVWPISTIAQWKVGVDYPASVVCSGPKYQYPYFTDNVHLTNEGYEQLGEKYAEVYFQRIIRGQPWQPLEPIQVQRQGRAITITYHVPNSPMTWNTTFSPPHPSIPQWKNARGFEVTASNGQKVEIDSATIDGNTVLLTCTTDPGPGARVSYATVGEDTAMSAPHRGTKHWGQLRDSDPFTGAVTGKAQPNYGVAFKMTAP